MFVFTEAGPRPDAVAGMLLLISGAAVTGLSLFLLFGKPFLIGTVVASAGVAMSGGGLSLLNNSTDVLRRLLEWMKRQISPLLESVKRQISPAPPAEG